MFFNAEAYDRYMGRWSRHLAPRILEFAGITEGSRVLDLGTGTGS
ncbi:MAG: SAM-dependent methyltransferase, partial [Chloroflexota bacterium]